MATQPLMLLDSTVGLSVNVEDYFNEIRSLRSLSVGLCTIANQIAAREKAWETQTAGTEVLFVLGSGPDNHPWYFGLNKDIDSFQL